MKTFFPCRVTAKALAWREQHCVSARVTQFGVPAY